MTGATARVCQLAVAVSPVGTFTWALQGRVDVALLLFVSAMLVGVAGYAVDRGVVA